MVSLIIHAFLVLFFISVISSSSEQSSPESSEGSPVSLVSQVKVTQRTKSVPPVVQPPVTHATKIGKPKLKPVLAGHRPVPTHRELAKQNPSAPPNPTPAPLVPYSPNPEPTQVAIVTPAPAQIPAVEISMATAPPLIAPQRHATAPPTIAPPTAAPSAKPSPVPAVQATAKPLIKATPQPSAAPTSAPATSAPKTFAASPQPQKSAAGISSPAPTGAPSPSSQRGQNASPGPKPLASTGSVPMKAKPAPARPITLPPTPTPQPTAPPTPRPRPTRTLKPTAASSLNQRLKNLIPNNPVDVHVGHYAGNIGQHIGYPTPPPEVLSATKFIYESKQVKGIFKIFGGREQRVVMYVTSVTRHGPISTCTGWLIRYPLPSDPYRSSAANGPFHGGAVPVDNPGPGGSNSYEPVVESNVTFQCESSRLQPFTASAPSPGP